MKGKKISGQDLTKDAIAITLGSFLSAVALYCFILPNGFVSGGVTGIAVLLENAGIIKSYISQYLMNIPLLIAALIKLRKDFAVKTVISTTLVSVFMLLMEQVGFMRFTEDRLLAAVYSGILYGIGIGMLFERGGSTGGSEIIANLIVKRNPAAKVSVLIMIMDVVIILAGLALYDGWSVVYAVVCAVATERAMSVYLDKGKIGGMYYVITDKPQKIAAALNEELGREGILFEATGGPTGLAKSVLQIFLPPRRHIRMKSIIEREDKESFSFVVSARAELKGNRIK